MKVYKDIITGDELFTDSYNIELNDGLYKIKAAYVTRSEKFDDSKMGANPSAEEENEGTEDSAVSGVNVVLDNRLQKTSFGTKKEFMVYFKDYVKRIEQIKKELDKDFKEEAFRRQIQDAFKIALAKFDNCEFYTGESCNPDGSIALVCWETPAGESDDVPFVYFFGDGVKEIKC